MSAVLRAVVEEHLAERATHQGPDLTDPALVRGRCRSETESFRAFAHDAAPGRLGPHSLLVVRARSVAYGREHVAAVEFGRAVPELSWVVDLTARQFAPHDQDSPWFGRLTTWASEVSAWLRGSDHNPVEITVHHRIDGPTVFTHHPPGK